LGFGLLILAVSCSSERPGIEISVENATPLQLDLRGTVERKSDQQSEEFSLSLPGQGDQVGPTLHRIDCPVQDFDFTFLLFREGESAPVSWLEGAWPGAAGISDGAWSNRILVEVRVREAPSGLELAFD
jgi:hypothetical protein